MTHEDGYRTLFIVGCPRSGTTWVQLLLDQSSGVATAPETQIFAYYLDWFRKQWRREHEGPGAELQGRAGLSRLLSEEEFRELCRTSAGFVLDRIAREGDGAAWVVEKSPMHVRLVDWIVELFPDARILHVIRDPRDTAASIVRAGRSWGRGWAPGGAVGAARLWRDTVEAGRRGGRDHPHYREVRYEDLRSAPVPELQRLLGWLGLPDSEAEASAAVEACELDRLRKGKEAEARPVPGGSSPRGFFGRGRVGGWEEELGKGGGRAVEAVCGPLMDELGYERRWPEGGPSLRVGVRDAVQRVRESVDWQLQKLVGRL